LKNYSGINIQWPISELILRGEKTVETRTYALPEKFLNVDMILIETPGKKGKFKARATAIIRFTNCFKYKSKSEFYNDYDRHLVTKNSQWAWSNKPKWGWEVEVIKKLAPFEVTSQGIIYRSDISI
jgi:hypothetical protein